MNEKLKKLLTDPDFESLEDFIYQLSYEQGLRGEFTDSYIDTYIQDFPLYAEKGEEERYFMKIPIYFYNDALECIYCFEKKYRCSLEDYRNWVSYDNKYYSNSLRFLRDNYVDTCIDVLQRCNILLSKDLEIDTEMIELEVCTGDTQYKEYGIKTFDIVFGERDKDWLDDSEESYRENNKIRLFSYNLPNRFLKKLDKSLHSNNKLLEKYLGQIAPNELDFLMKYFGRKYYLDYLNRNKKYYLHVGFGGNTSYTKYFDDERALGKEVAYLQCVSKYLGGVSTIYDVSPFRGYVFTN